MPIRKIRIRIEAAFAGHRLDQVLAQVLPGHLGRELSKGNIRKLIVAGAVYLNGKRVRIASKPLFEGTTLEAWIDEEKIEAGLEKTARLSFQVEPSWILFEDEHIIVASKPAGLPTQPTLDEARDNMYSLLKKFLKDRAGPGGGDPYLGLHHRLDRDTSGVILFTKTKEANPGISVVFAERQAKKTYQALALRPRGWKEPPQGHWRVENYLKKERTGRGKQSWMVPTRSGGDFALTQFKVLELAPRGLWIEARPETGRMHQIRVHLAEGATPILGDDLYGSGARWPAGLEVPRIMLHAVSLTFPHPITKSETSVFSPPPEDFQECLAQLRMPESTIPGSRG